MNVVDNMKRMIFVAILSLLFVPFFSQESDEVDYDSFVSDDEEMALDAVSAAECDRKDS